jgi:hypothetical protein
VRRRQGLIVLATTLVLAFSVAWAHSGMAMDHMGTPAAMCLAIVDGAMLMGAAVLVAAAPGPPRPDVPELRAPLELLVTSPARSIPARAGPSLLQVFRL